MSIRTKEKIYKRIIVILFFTIIILSFSLFYPSKPPKTTKKDKETQTYLNLELEHRFRLKRELYKQQKKLYREEYRKLIEKTPPTFTEDFLQARLAISKRYKKYISPSEFTIIENEEFKKLYYHPEGTII